MNEFTDFKKLKKDDLVKFAEGQKDEINSYFRKLEIQEKQLAEIKEVIQEAQLHQRYRSGERLPDQLQGVISRYEDWARQNVLEMRKFRDEVETYLRSLALLMDTLVEAGWTHRMKEIFTGGILGHIESSVTKLNRMNFEWEHTFMVHFPSVFSASEWPTKHLHNIIDQKDAEIERLKKEAKNDSDDISETMPF